MPRDSSYRLSRAAVTTYVARVAKQPFVVDEYVRWSDVDRAGIIFYGSYVRFFEIAETEMFRELGIPYGEVFDSFGVWFPRVHLESDFMYPARLDDRLRVAAYFTSFGRSSFTIAFDVWHVGAERLAAAGHEVLVCTDQASLRPIPLPGELSDLLKGYLLTVDQARAFLASSGPH